MPWMNLNDLKGYTFFLPRTALRYAALRTLTLRHRRPQRRWRQRRWRWRRSDRGTWCTPCACEAGFKNRWKSCSITISINIDHHLYMDLFPNGFQCSSFFSVLSPICWWVSLWNSEVIHQINLEFWESQKSIRSDTVDVDDCLFLTQQRTWG